MHSTCRWAGDWGYTPYPRVSPQSFLSLCSRSVAFNHALLMAIFKREDTSECWAPVASSGQCILNLLWKWSSAYGFTDISSSPLNDWLSKAQQNSCTLKYGKLTCTLNQPTILFMITIVTMTLLVIEKSFPDWWHLPEGQFCGNTSAARRNLFSEQLNGLCRTVAISVHFRHCRLRRYVCLHLIFQKIYLLGDQNVISLHIPARFQEKGQEQFLCPYLTTWNSSWFSHLVQS